ncbi:MAG: DNA polymerase III subunit delta [Candidatus Binatia bacterium]
MSKGDTPKAVTLFLGEASVVDPLAHALVNQSMEHASQALDFEIFRFGERPLSEIEAGLRQVGMFSKRRCIWLRGFVEAKRKPAAGVHTEEVDDDDENSEEEAGGAAELLALLEAGVPDGTLLVVSAPNLDARGRLYKWFAKNADVVDRRLQVEHSGPRAGKLGETGLRRAIEARLQELGVRPASGVVDEIAKRSGSVIGETLQEIDRLVLAQPDPTRLGAAEVRDGMRDLALGWVFDLTKAIEARNLAAAESLVARLLAEGEAPLRLTALLAGLFGDLVAARPYVDSLPPAVMRLSGPAFVNGPGASMPENLRSWKGYFRLHAAAKFKVGELERLHRQVLQLDLALKSSPAPPLMLFSRLLQSACIPGAVH